MEFPIIGCFEQTGEDTSVYFKDKKIWGCGKKYREYQGKYPVVFVTFKDVKFETWEETFAALKDVFSKEAYRHMELQDSGQCDAYDKRRFERILAGEANEVELSGALADLSRMLHRHLSYGFLTGVLRVAKESIFSGLNNLAIYSVLDHKYSAYFGFTPEEVRKMAAYYGVSDRYEEICEWYDGYRFGRTEIFNPWSVISYFHNECEPRAFGQSTGSNDIIGEMIAAADQETYDRLISLVNGGSFTTYIDTDVIYPQIEENPSTIYSFLLVAGYLKPIKAAVSFNGDFMCEVTLPNKEIAFVYNEVIYRYGVAFCGSNVEVAVE